MTKARAPGKVILFGEHAVVYGRPAIAVPVTEVQAEVHVDQGPARQGTRIVAPDVGQQFLLREAVGDEPLARVVKLTLKRLGRPPDPDLVITIRSDVPIARGMGSGAAVSTALVRALVQHFDRWLPSREISDLVYQGERLYHGTPSGVDNTVIAFEKPVFFIKDEGWEFFWVGAPFLLAIADTGIKSPTREAVGDLRRRYEAEPDRYRPLFDQVGEIVVQARAAIEGGQAGQVGELMDANHDLLQQMGVSCVELDRLVVAAREGGALGAKLCGAGWGGNMIALVTQETRGRVDMMLRLAGAKAVIVTEIR